MLMPSPGKSIKRSVIIEILCAAAIDPSIKKCLRHIVIKEEEYFGPQLEKILK